MARWLDARAADFASGFEALLSVKRESDDDVSAIVRAIIADVRARGDAALIDLSKRFDGAELTQETLRVSPEEIAAAMRGAAPTIIEALRLAAARIETYHRRQLPQDESFTDSAGATLGFTSRAAQPAIRARS